MQAQLTLEECPKCKTDLGPYMALPTPPAFCLQCKFPLMLIAGKYQLLEVLGEGGFGTVYLARHVRLNSNAERVVKLIKPDIFKYEGMAKRFMREVQVTSDLSQRNEHIVRIYDDFGEQPHLGHYYVMEFLQGRPLLDYVKNPRQLPEIPWVLNIFQQICEAMQEAHEEGIVHRDLKPENILLIERRKHPYFVKILDFGIAKPLETDGTATKLTQGALGTPYYMSPEQTVNKPTDGRSDIYSMSIMLYEMLTGAHPFIPKGREHDISAMELMSAHVMQDIPNPVTQHPERKIPPGIGEAILKGAHKSPDMRFQTADEFWAAVSYAAGPLASCDPEDLPAMLPRAMRQTPSEQLRSATNAYAHTVAPEVLSPVFREQNDGPRSTPSRASAPTGGGHALSSGVSSTPQILSRSKQALSDSSVGQHQRNLASFDQVVEAPPKRGALFWGALAGLLLGLGAIAGVGLGWLKPKNSTTSMTQGKDATPEPRKDPTPRMDPSPRPTFVPANSAPDAGDALPSRPAPSDRPVDRPVVREVRPAPPRPVVRVRPRPYRRRWRARVKPPKRVVAPPPAPVALCSEPGWVQLQISPCGSGEGRIDIDVKGRKLRGQKVCVPPGTNVMIEQVRCSACVFKSPRNQPIMKLYLKDADKVEYDTGKACLKP